MSFTITATCVDIMDQSCVKECPVDCIYVGNRQLYINPDECIDCGACEPVCPVEAIYHEDELPAEHAEAITRQRELFATLGPLGGARRHPPLGTDHPFVAALPVRDTTS